MKTDNKNSWYQDIDGCGVQCQNPLFTEEEHHKVHIFIAVFGSLCMACTLFTVVCYCYSGVWLTLYGVYTLHCGMLLLLCMACTLFTVVCYCYSVWRVRSLLWYVIVIAVFGSLCMACTLFTVVCYCYSVWRVRSLLWYVIVIAVFGVYTLYCGMLLS